MRLAGKWQCLVRHWEQMSTNPYTGLGIKERFILMCAAFGCNQYEVDDDLSVME